MKSWHLDPWKAFLAAAVFLLASGAGAGEGALPAIETLDPPQAGFYGRVLSLDGIPIKTHAVVSDAAIYEVYHRLSRLLAHLPQARSNLVSAGAEFHVIGQNQMMVDLPECQMWKGKKFEGDLTLDQRDRGWGGLMSSCGEENLLALPTDRYRDHRDICTHEFAHTLMAFGLSDDIVRRIKEQYQSSVSKGLWKAYAGTNPDEFFAELTMWYFGSRGDYGKITPPPQPGKAWLAAYRSRSLCVAGCTLHWAGHVGRPCLEAPAVGGFGQDFHASFRPERAPQHFDRAQFARLEMRSVLGGFFRQTRALWRNGAVRRLERQHLRHSFLALYR